MSHWDVFNGDADGICALHQLRLADARAGMLVSGVKRDIGLLQRVPAQAGDTVTVLDVSLERNREALLELLARGVEVEYFDHQPLPPNTRHRSDPRLHDADLRAFVSDPSKIGQAYLGEFVVWESSGSTGEPAIFVQDARAMAVYDALEACRRVQRWRDPWNLGGRIAFVGATGGHFASNVTAQRLRRLNPAMAANLSVLSFLQPTAALVEQLNDLAPTIVSTYPTAALPLAEEAAAGRLRISAREIWTGGETLTAGMRLRIERQFGCQVINSYGASEFSPRNAAAARCT